MATYIDSNFGTWEDMSDPENVEHYKRVQRTNVLKTCEACGEEVMLQPQYAICNHCADMREKGWEY